MELYSFLRVGGGYEVYRGRDHVRIGRLEGRTISLVIPAADYCDRNGVSLDRLRHRKLHVRGPSLWTTVEMSHV